ncbi:MAG: undecaprenyldiphospho-muramoylpentapeptide beta-N-acetylglucosaminyltransferase [Actinomycetaceae bacterium]|nr:undecaprenyldiphospho-muramoylpentapeptide beta-N-acetylglucosaminyltransferase [Actinomycetaceae bacterium]
MSSIKVVLAGGGTAGHVNPLLATATLLRERGADVVVVGTREGLEADLVPNAGFSFETIDRVPFPRRPNMNALRFPRDFHRVRAQTGRICDDFQPDVLVGFGGYVSTPMYLEASKRSIPIVLHEQNAKPGLANKLGARMAHTVALTFASTPLKAAKGTTITVGLPLRPAIAELAFLGADERAGRRLKAADNLGLNPEMPTLLVTGGSLGAQHINEVLEACLEPIADADIQVLHLTGKGKDEPIRTALEKSSAGEHYHVREYLETMEDAYALADLVVCRSGAGTVAELAALGIPAVYVPLPIGNGEQELNAADVVAAGGGILVRNADFTAHVLVNEVLPLLGQPETLRTMGAAARSTSPTDAAERLADVIIGVAEENK